MNTTSSSYLGSDAPPRARAALRARLALKGVLAYEDALIYVEDAPGTTVTVREDGSVSVTTPTIQIDTAPFEPCSDHDWERLLESVRYWCAAERSIFGDRAWFHDLEDQVAILPANMAGTKVRHGDVRLALRYCGWEPIWVRGIGHVWQRRYAPDA